MAMPSNQWLHLVSPNSNLAGPFLYRLPSSHSGMEPAGAEIGNLDTAINGGHKFNAAKRRASI